MERWLRRILGPIKRELADPAKGTLFTEPEHERIELRQARALTMEFCEQCGSSSRDKDGFCRGCGAAWPLETPATETKPTRSKTGTHLEKLPAKIGPIALPDARPKKVWLAVLLGLVCGPLGLLYSTITGTLVMLFVSMVLWIKFGDVSILIVQPVCAIWAWRAARESSATLV